MATIEIIKALFVDETSRIGEDFGSVSLRLGDETPDDNVYIAAAGIDIVSEDPALSDYLSYEIGKNSIQFTNTRPIDSDNPDTPISFTFTAVFDIDKITVRNGEPTFADYKVIEKTYTIKVVDLNDETPSDFQLLGSSIPESASAGKLVGRLFANDPDRGDTLTYTLLDDPSGNFELVGGRLLLKAGATLDHEARSSHDVVVKVEDEGSHDVTRTFTIDVLDAVEGATDIMLEGGSISELAEAGTVVGTLSGLDPDGDPSRLTYAINQGRFVIDGDKIVLGADAKLNYETLPEIFVTITATDPDGGRYKESFTIVIENGVEVRGTGGADQLKGGNSGDEIWAFGGSDQIYAAAGDDRIWAGLGVDRVNGGTGRDHFIFKKVGELGDIITDFESGEDKIALSAALAEKMRFDDVTLFINEAIDAEGPVLAYREDTGALTFDVDGLGDKRPVLIATLLDTPSLTENDFIIV